MWFAKDLKASGQVRCVVHQDIVIRLAVVADNRLGLELPLGVSWRPMPRGELEMGWIRGLVALLLGLAWAVQAADKPACRAVFDAGSSGTRLFLYVQQKGGWHPWPGAKLGALADPVRQHQGPKAMAALAADLANSLEALRQAGPINSEGQPRWQGFDWQQACRLQSVSVLATAGMRLAEQQDPVASAALWQEVQQALAGLLGPAVAIDARTLTGFEEGLYAWLAARARLGRCIGS